MKVRFVAGIVLALALGVQPQGALAQATQYTFTKIANTTDRPSLDGVSCVALNNLGNVLIGSNVPNSPNELLMWDGQALNVIVTGVGGCPPFNDANETAYGVTLSNGARALARNTNGVLTIVATSASAPAYEPGNNPAPPLSNSGSVAFLSSGSAPGTGFGAGIYIAPGGVTVYNAATDPPLIGVSQPRSMNDSNVVVFRATRSTPSGSHVGIYRGSSVPLLESGDVVSGGTVLVGASVGPLVINNVGTVAFVGSVGGVGGLYTTSDGSTVNLVGSPPFADFSINDSGAVAFRRAQSIGSGVYVGRPGSINEKVIAFGDDLDGSKVRDAHVWRQAMNDKGQIAFWASLEDGRWGVYRADPVDSTPPVVTPPAPITVSAATALGTTGNDTPDVAAFLGGGTATDAVDPAPVRLTPQVNGTDVTNDTIFPIGATTVTFRFRDSSNNIGTATSTITVNLSSLPPVAINGTLGVVAGASANGTLVANDPEAAALNFTIVVNGQKGTATVTNAATGAYTYTANVGTSGDDAFTFKANDGQVDSNIATVTVTITAANQPPSATNDSVTTGEDTPVSGTLVASTPNGAPLTFSLMSTGTLGTAILTDATAGTYTYTPNSNAHGADSFTFKVSNGTQDSNLATVTLAITPVNDAPVAHNANLAATENTPVAGSLSASDADGDALNFSIVANGSIGTAVITNAATGAFTYTPNPGAFGTDTVQFKAEDQALSSNTGVVTVTVSKPVAGISPGSIGFGNQLTGVTSTGQAVTLSNTGNAVLLIHSISITGPHAGDFGKTMTCGASLSPGGVCTITVTFTPTATGLRTALLDISTNSHSMPNSTAALSGTGTSPAASLSAVTLNFGNVNVSSISGARSMTVVNSGTGPLIFSARTITGLHSSDFQFTPVDNTCNGSIPPGASCTVSVAFAPTNTGTRTAAVTLTSNAGGSPHSITLTGSGKPGPVTLTPSPLTFSVQTLNTPSSAQAVLIKNTDAAPVNILNVTANGDFSVPATTCGTTLAGGATCTASIVFAPAASGTRSGVLTVGTSAGTVTATLNGTGTIVALSTVSLNYGDQPVGSISTPRAVIVSNVSTDVSLAISGIILEGNAAEDYVVAQKCGTSILPGGSCTFDIAFKPTKKGTRKATFAVVHNSNGSPHIVSLEGAGK